MKRKELKNLSLEEFTKIINDLQVAFEFEEDMLDMSRKYIEKHVLFDYISTSSTFLANAVWTLLNKTFNFFCQKVRVDGVQHLTHHSTFLRVLGL